jgi:hypothetical protein
LYSDVAVFDSLVVLLSVPRVMQKEQEMEEELLSQRLPEQLREQLYGTFGTWVQHGKLFGRALPPMSTAEQDLRGGDATVLSNTLADDPVALDPSLDAPQKAPCPTSTGTGPSRTWLSGKSTSCCRRRPP